MTHLLRGGNARVTAPESLARTPTEQSGTTVSRSDTARASSSPSARSSRSPRNAGRRTCQCSSRGLGNPAWAHSRGCPRSKLWMESRGFLSGPGPVPDRHQTLDEGELAARVPDHAQPDFSRHPRRRYRHWAVQAAHLLRFPHSRGRTGTFGRQATRAEYRGCSRPSRYSCPPRLSNSDRRSRKYTSAPPIRPGRSGIRLIPIRMSPTVIEELPGGYARRFGNTLPPSPPERF